MNKKDFTRHLMQWHNNENTRQMPWKGEKDPYKIWLSEVILQQTRVDQGWSYYEKFIYAYPTVQSLANAEDEAVFKLWEGLGYYNRCKNLLYSARSIAGNFDGKFPRTYEEIIALKGVGPYTAAAIASFAFNLPFAVVDGNVFRVLARYFGIETATDSSEGKKIFSALAQDLIDKKNAGLYNQAIMDFGATICKPALPLCNTCTLRKNCTAYKKGWVNHLPVKEKTLTKKNRWFTWFLFTHAGKILVNKRTGNDIWQSLYEFYLIESDEHPYWNAGSISAMLKQQLGITDETLLHTSTLFSQQLTHQHIRAQFIRIALPSVPTTLKSYDWVEVNELRRLAFPGIINQYLQVSALQSTLF